MRPRQRQPGLVAATGNRVNMDALAWHVDARNGESGFSPHRDRQPEVSPSTFRSDGSAMYTTCWIALSDATPETGCLYVIPRNCDPGYFEGVFIHFSNLCCCLNSQDDGWKERLSPDVISGNIYL
jgi:hypothetical protein